MGFDAALKRYFPLVLCGLLAIVAYFQAAGIGQLVGASVALDPSATPVAPLPALPVVAAKPQADDHATSAQAILDRNPFDSATGPLNGKPIETPTDTPVDVNKDPLADPACDTGRVLLIMQSDDPSWSFASMASSDGKTQLRRMGDEYAGQTVWFIGWNTNPDPLFNGPTVWLTSGSNRCRVKLGAKDAKAAPASGPTPAPSADPGKKKSSVPDDIANKIHKVSANEFNIERSVVDQILENQADLMRTARIVPEKEGDKVVGIRLFGIKKDSLLGMLGIENGDRLSSINGFEMSDPQKALEAYTRLRTADHLTVSVARQGKPMNIDFNIK
jgi:general secretion pathway protein C